MVCNTREVMGTLHNDILFQIKANCSPKEFFAAGVEDVETITSGRRRPIALGQVGIRCRHCAHLPLRHRKKAAIYYPTRLKGIYQAAQNMNASHLADACLNVDPSTKVQLVAFQQNKSTTGHGGKVRSIHILSGLIDPFQSSWIVDCRLFAMSQW